MSADQSLLGEFLDRLDSPPQAAQSPTSLTEMRRSDGARKKIDHRTDLPVNGRS